MINKKCIKKEGTKKDTLFIKESDVLKGSGLNTK